MEQIKSVIDVISCMASYFSWEVLLALIILVVLTLIPGMEPERKVNLSWGIVILLLVVKFVQWLGLQLTFMLIIIVLLCMIAFPCMFFFIAFVNGANQADEAIQRHRRRIEHSLVY